MDRRLELHDRLLQVCDHVYFQPPESIKLHYPCVVYELSDVFTDYANDHLYKARKRYSVTVMDRDPDSSIFMDIMHQFVHCEFDRSFQSDGLNHWVLTLFY